MVKRSPPCVSHKIAVSSHASSRRRRRGRRRRRVTSLRGTRPKGVVSACRRFVLRARSARRTKSTRNHRLHHHLSSAPREAASKHGETMTMACLRIVSNWTSLLTRRTNDFRSPNDVDGALSSFRSKPGLRREKTPPKTVLSGRRTKARSPRSPRTRERGRPNKVRG